MPIKIEMPRLSDTMEEGTLVKWRVSVGDKVASGDHLADVETDKATMELQAFDDGTVASLAIEEGQTVPVGQVIVVLAEEGESVEEAMQSAGETGGDSRPADTDSAAEPDEAGQETTAAEATRDAPPTPTPSGGGSAPKSTKASPLARKLAEEHGVDITTVEGSGPGGRVIKRDILAAAEGKAPAKPAAQPASAGGAKQAQPPKAVQAAVAGGIQLKSEEVSLSNMRKTIARRLVESKTQVPHFQVTVAVEMDALLALRKTVNDQLESQGVKLTVGDFVSRAAALACVQHPDVNASWAGDKIIKHGTVNVGVAISLPGGGGLVVATVRDVQNKGLRQISAETKTLAAKARDTGLTIQEMEDATITISNLGMPQYAVEHFTAIINPPQAAILAVGGTLQKPVVRDGQIVVGQVMNVTMSADHRVIDGLSAAEYLATFRQLLENPASLLV